MNWKKMLGKKSNPRNFTLLPYDGLLTLPSFQFSKDLEFNSYFCKDGKFSFLNVLICELSFNCPLDGVLKRWQRALEIRISEENNYRFKHFVTLGTLQAKWIDRVFTCMRRRRKDHHQSSHRFHMLRLFPWKQNTIRDLWLTRMIERNKTSEAKWCEYFIHPRIYIE